MEGLQPPKKGEPKYPYATMKELRQHAEKNNLSIAQMIMANDRGSAPRWAEAASIRARAYP
jgi:L-serine deaminase